jgi:ubiquinone biosynthesis protein UbiJ
MDDVDRLRDDVDRVAARLDLLAGSDRGDGT